MSEYVFAKFAKRKRGKSNSQFIVTTEENTAKKWIEKSSEKEKIESIGEAKSPEDEFSRIQHDIFETFIGFYDFIPMLMSVSSHYPNMVVDNDILPLLKEKGNVLNEDDDYILYKTGIEQYPPIKKALKRMRSVRSIVPILPRFYIMGLISHYDSFIHQIGKATIKFRPDIVFNKESQINYAELATYLDMNDAKQHVIEKEIEKLLRESHEEQLRWFANKLDMKIEPRRELYINFIELCDRRNLLAHAGGIISKSYIDKGKKIGYFKDGTLTGEIIETGPKYFKAAVDILIEMAFQLLVVIWNKIDPSAGASISKSLINITYNLILEEKYHLAIRLIEFVLENKSLKMDQATRNYHVINCANAAKLSGRNDYKKIIDSVDWSASTEDFLICKAAILDDIDQVIELMPIVSKTGKITSNGFREWPIFLNIRKEERFLAKFREIFGEPLLLERSDRENSQMPKEKHQGAEVVEITQKPIRRRRSLAKSENTI